MANYLWLLNDGSSRILLNNGTDKLALNEEVVAEAYGWQQPPSEPKRNYTKRIAERAMVAALAGCILTPIAYPGNGDVVAFTVTTSQRFDKTIVYQDLAYTPYVPPVEEVTVDKYARPFSEPTRRKVFLEGDVAFYPLPIPAWGWHPALSEPTKRVTTRQQQALISVPFVEDTTTLAAKWFRPLSEPTRRVTTRQQQELASIPFIEDAAIQAKWFQPFGTPLRLAVTRQHQTFAFYSLPIPDEVVEEEIIVASSNTTVRFRKTLIYDDIIYAPYPVDVQPEIVTSDKWFAPFSQPRFVKRITGEEGSAFYVGDDPDKYGWRGPLSEPVRRKPPAREGDYTTAPTQPQANDGTGWHRPFSEPTRRKVFLEGDTAYSPTLVEDAAIQAKWFQPFGMPRAAKRVPEFPAYSYSPYFVPPISGVGTEFNWWPNLSERLRQRRPVAQQQAVIQGPTQPITVTLEYAWHRPFNEPVRRKAEAQTAGARFAPFPQITIAWHQPLSTPTRRVVRQAYPALSWTGQTISGVTGVASVTLGSPVFSRHVIAQTLAFVHPPADVAWHQPLSVPVRRKRQAQTAGAAFVFAPAKPGVGVGTDQPWPPFSEPVRFKLSLKTWQQQFLIYYPLLLSSDLDPACRVIDTFETGGVVVSADDVVVTFGQSDVTPAADEDLIPHPGNTVKVKC
jgi:hypothetical protein